MSFPSLPSAKKSNKSEMSDREVDIKYKMFERLSQKGFLQTMQKQMRKAIEEEMNGKTDSRDANRDDNQSEEKPIDCLERVSSIANWEKQIRSELEIDREIQNRELERQRDKLKNDIRKLNERDKCLRIELDARERKVRLREEELHAGLEELNQKWNEITAKEESINSIVSEKIKSEMKDEIEKLKKKFNELETNKSNLIKREEKVKEVEQRLHEQVIIVKEKIDNKRVSEIELAKSRKDLEIIRKENEVLKQRVDSMEDYPITKFENKALKNELNAIKETLKNKLIEFEVEKEKLEKLLKESDEKVLNLKIDLRKSEHELLLLKQKHQGDIDHYTAQIDQTNTQLQYSKRMLQQLQHKNHLISKEMITNQKVTQKLFNDNLTQTEGQKFGCYICDHDINGVNESALEFMVSQNYNYDPNKHLISEQDFDSQPKSALNRENSLKISERIQTEVPLNESRQTSASTHAIQLTQNSAKHTYKQNGSQSVETNIEKPTLNREDVKTSKNTLNYNNNKHLVEDYNKDISDTFEW